MRKTFFFIILQCSILFAQAQIDTLLLPYDATSLTQEQLESNPTILAYPTSLKNQIPEMKCDYYFTINDEGGRVEFSPGNLQYQASTGLWRFAEHQWDLVGDNVIGTVYENGVKCDNTQIGNSYTGWIDLFAWGTSGWFRGYAEYYMPTSTDDNPYESQKYYIRNHPSQNLAGTNADWGVYNQIGQDAPNTWRTLLATQWNYILLSRPNAYNLWCMATIGDTVTGCILLPDNWHPIEGLALIPRGDESINVFSFEDWNILENHGAVFLPKAGRRVVKAYTDASGYWSSTANTTRRLNWGSMTYSAYAYCVTLSSISPSVSTERRCYGLAVRLVKDIDN